VLWIGLGLFLPCGGVFVSGVVLGGPLGPAWILFTGYGGLLILGWYFSYRSWAIARGNPDAFHLLVEAAADDDLQTLLAGLQQKRRAPRVAACRTLLAVGPRAAPLVFPLIDALWGNVPLRGNWPPAQLPPAEKVCKACGKILRFWNRHLRAQVCGSCLPHEGAYELTEDDLLPSRGWAARVLGGLGPVAAWAIPALSAAAQFDPSPLVREEALAALPRVRN